MQILNIAGYKFTELADLSTLKTQFYNECAKLGLKGTILLSYEGVNINLAGTIQAIQSYKASLAHDVRFSDMTWRESYSVIVPFKRLKVKLKKEIITLRKPEIKPQAQKAPQLAPEKFKQWLDENRDIIVLDTRNDYEIEFGSFKNSIHLNLKHFTDFAKVSSQVAKEKPIVMFCTGGIRCEKAALHMINEGYKDVYQLQGGILNYFSEVGGSHYDGDCYVFDERVALTPDLEAAINRVMPACF
ncbi:MAG: hypothetical protein A3F14_00510 [Gammaproteobacteria bacterium RIFCSPHIGHO2_12_FULL_43_28]|nr:MAG: hypothetical protein A3F14_00510 [Gammaproteobacteria bacterium RIFCSPHIGHO2_12_FULL_43_28]